MKILKGFTLSEVLITLVIIGVIAAITVPLIVTNYQKQQTVSKLKKVYSTISNAVNLSSLQNGSSSDNWANDSDYSALEYFNTYLKPYMQILKTCKNNVECGYTSSTPWSYLSGTVYDWHLSEVASTRKFFYLSDGVFVAIKTGYLDAASGEAVYSNIVFFIDVNGTKGPNKFGRDVFVLQDTESKGILPNGAGYSQTDINNNCKSGGSGTYCFQKIVNDSWEIKSDYPW